MTRVEELREALENLYFTRKYYFGILAEMEFNGQGFGPEYKRIGGTINIINNNILRLENELEKAEKKEFEEAEQFRFFQTARC